MQWLKDFLQRMFARLFVKPAAQSSPPEPTQQTRKTEAQANASKAEPSRFWQSRKTLLESLDDYFETARALQKASSEEFYLLSKIGAYPRAETEPMTVQKYQTGIECNEFCISREEIPAYAALTAPRWVNEKGVAFSPAIAICTRVRDPIGVQPSKDPIVRIYCGWRNKKGKLDFYRAHVAVAEDMSLTILKEFEVAAQTIRPKRRRRGGPKERPFQITRGVWRYPEWLEFKSSEEDDGVFWREWTPQQRINSLFWDVQNNIRHANSDVTVRARKGGIIATFTVDMLKTPYFFTDRVKVKTSSGRAKPIFHIVRTHKRTVGNSANFVKSHFRGLRRFLWNGYDVSITVAGKHHVDMFAFTAASEEYGLKQKTPKGSLSGREVWRKHLKQIYGEAA